MVGPPFTRMMKPTGFPPYSVGLCSSFLKPEEWRSGTIVTATSSVRSIVPPMLPAVAMAVFGSIGYPACMSAWDSSYAPTNFALVFLASATASPTWSEWPCVTRMKSTFSGGAALPSLFEGFENQGSMASTVHLGVFTVNAAWPYQVTCVLPPPAAVGLSWAAPARGTAPITISAASVRLMSPPVSVGGDGCQPPRGPATPRRVPAHSGAPLT